MKKLFTFIIAAALFLFPATFAMAGEHGHWGYEGHSGPEHWGDLSPEFATCKIGGAQSPVDIVKTMPSADLKPLALSYSPVPVAVLNNGHTLQGNYATGSSVTIDDVKYDLLQFHFHTPSENTVNGKPFPMEIHLVHKNKDTGALAVIGVMVEEGNENPVIASVWKEAPAEAGQTNNGSATLNAQDLLPSDLSFYHFTGSLTTPPCTEDVNWNVLKNPITASKAQIEFLTKTLGTENARPTQPLNGRVVLEGPGK